MTLMVMLVSVGHNFKFCPFMQSCTCKSGFQISFQGVVLTRNLDADWINSHHSSQITDGPTNHLLGHVAVFELRPCIYLKH